MASLGGHLSRSSRDLPRPRRRVLSTRSPMQCPCARMREHAAHDRSARLRPGGATPSSTRSTRARSRIPAPTARATCAGSPRVWITSATSAPTRSGCRPSTRRRMADGGYDVAGYEDVDPRFGTLADAVALIAAAHERGLKLLMDVVPCHTSIEHPWFADHPERYVWADGDAPPNNWVASFGGPAWSRDEASGRWYLHSFYPEQPDLDWRRADVRAAIGRSLRFWLRLGVDGFRLDAIDRLLKDPQLRDDPPASAPPALPEHGDAGLLDHVNSRNAPDIGIALEALRHAAGDDTLLVGEVYLPAAQLAPYLAHVDTAFAFELLHAPWDAAAVRGAIEAALDPGGAAGRVAWVLSNHDFPRLPDRVGARNTRAAALLALTLPGPVFVYQGDEIGMADGPGGDPPHDRAGRDRHRHPMRWDDDAPHGGFTAAGAQPWLPAIAVTGGGVAQQSGDPGSVLSLYRDLIAARRALGAGARVRRRRRRRRARLPPRGPPPRRAEHERRAAAGAAGGGHRRARDAPGATSRGSAGARAAAPGGGVPGRNPLVRFVTNRVWSRHGTRDRHGSGNDRHGAARRWMRRRFLLQRGGHAALVHLQRAERRPAEDRRSLLEAVRRQVRHQVRVPALAGRPAARAARPPPRRQGQHDGPARARRRLDRRVRERRLARARAAEHGEGRVGERVRLGPADRALQEPPLHGADLVQHRAAVVPQGSRPEPAQDLGRAARPGREARAVEGALRGAGQPLRGPRRARQPAHRVRRHVDPRRSDDHQARQGADRARAADPRPPVALAGAPVEPDDDGRGRRTARVRRSERREQHELHDQLPLRLSVGEVQPAGAGHLQGDGRGEVPAGRSRQAEQAADRRHQHRHLRVLQAQGGGVRGGGVPRQAREPARGRDPRRAAAGALGPLRPP